MSYPDLESRPEQQWVWPQTSWQDEEKEEQATGKLAKRYTTSLLLLLGFTSASEYSLANFDQSWIISPLNPKNEFLGQITTRGVRQ